MSTFIQAAAILIGLLVASYVVIRIYFREKREHLRSLMTLEDVLLEREKEEHERLER